MFISSCSSSSPLFHHLLPLARHRWLCHLGWQIHVLLELWEGSAFLTLIVHWLFSLCCFLWHICRFGIGPDEWPVVLLGAILIAVHFCSFCTSSACFVRMPIFSASGTVWAICCYVCCTFKSVARLLLGTIPCLVPFIFVEGAQDLVIVPRLFSHCYYTVFNSRANPYHPWYGPS